MKLCDLKPGVFYRCSVMPDPTEQKFLGVVVLGWQNWLLSRAGDKRMTPCFTVVQSPQRAGEVGCGWIAAWVQDAEFEEL